MIAQNGYEFAARWTRGMSTRDIQDVSGAIERMMVRLERWNFASVAQESRTTDDHDESTTFEADVYRLLDKPEYPPSLIARNELTRYERFFVEVAKTLRGTADNAENGGADLSEFEDELLRFDSLQFEYLTLDDPLGVPKSTVLAALRDADAIRMSLRLRALSDAVAGWANSHSWTLASNLDEQGSSNRIGCI